MIYFARRFLAFSNFFRRLWISAGALNSMSQFPSLLLLKSSRGATGTTFRPAESTPTCSGCFDLRELLFQLNFQLVKLFLKVKIGQLCFFEILLV